MKRYQGYILDLDGTIYLSEPSPARRRRCGDCARQVAA